MQSTIHINPYCAKHDGMQNGPNKYQLENYQMNQGVEVKNQLYLFQEALIEFLS